MSVITLEENSPMTKSRIAVLGMAKSGKTHFLNTVEIEHLRKYGDTPLRKYFSMNELYDSTDYVRSNRHALNREGVWKKDQLESLLLSKTDCDLLLVDDVLFEWELEVLKSFNFTLVYITSPWYSRFNRLHNPTHSDFKWMCSVEEINFLNSSNEMKNNFQMVEYVEECHDLHTFITTLI